MSPFSVIFDLNGTLVDTDTAYFLAYRDVLAKYGIPFTLENFTGHWSTKGKKLDEYLTLIGRDDLLPECKTMLEEKEKIFHDTIDERVTLMDGAKEILSRTKAAGVPMGLDSSTSRESIEHTLSCVGLGGIFEHITSWDMNLDENKYGDRKKKKSRLSALADILGIAPEKTVVIGDAEKDLRGAKESGMKAIAVPNSYTKNNDFSLADAFFGSLNEIEIEAIARVAGA
jgi:beta-phosphoglucomutase-like phosphatase (HAD superfamily)